MGIIAALKKRCKYLDLKDVLDFYKFDDESKNRKKDQRPRLCRRAAGVLYRNPTHLLNVANYVKDAWDSISQTSNKKCFHQGIINEFRAKIGG
jgi:hypothetical protein